MYKVLADHNRLFSSLSLSRDFNFKIVDIAIEFRDPNHYAIRSRCKLLKLLSNFCCDLSQKPEIGSTFTKPAVFSDELLATF